MRLLNLRQVNRETLNPAAWRAWLKVNTSGFGFGLKPRGQAYLVARDPPVGPAKFRTRAWEIANTKARELGWIV